MQNILSILVMKRFDLKKVKNKSVYHTYEWLFDYVCVYHNYEWLWPFNLNVLHFANAIKILFFTSLKEMQILTLINELPQISSVE